MRILVVDDEFVALTKMVSILSAYGECDTASDGGQALEMFQRSYIDFKFYDLITIDIYMPTINGLDLLKKISSDEKFLFLTPSKKIIVTAEGTQINVLQAIENKCDCFLVKPIKKETLDLKLKEIGVLKPSLSKY